MRMAPTIHSKSPFELLHGFLPSLIDPLNEMPSKLAALDPSDDDICKYASILSKIQT